MALWCFRCDAPIAGETCPDCGRPGTPVEDVPHEPRERAWAERIRHIPSGVWLLIAAVVILILFALMQSGFRLE